MRKHVGRRVASVHGWSQGRPGLLTLHSHAGFLTRTCKEGLGTWERPGPREHPAGELCFPKAAMDLTWPCDLPGCSSSKSVAGDGVKSHPRATSGHRNVTR